MSGQKLNCNPQLPSICFSKKTYKNTVKIKDTKSNITCHKHSKMLHKCHKRVTSDQSDIISGLTKIRISEQIMLLLISISELINKQGYFFDRLMIR